ncbi:PAS domain-containing sensor histidine kinase [Pedococcus sp. 2YAF34]|uniref:PAS domain-containing sensor histidine kinase n=1 Tax=Pedococcus sp. 2YAF34 TaxID=3233032 RepID=UPI003F94C252
MTQDTWLSAEGGIEVGPQVVFGMDANGTCTTSVGPGLAALGFAPGELVGQNLREVYRDDPLGTEALDAALSGERYHGEREYLGRRLALYFEPIHDEAGVLTGAVGIATDVTEQRRAEAQARAQARRTLELAADLSRFKALVEASPDFIAIADLDGAVEYVNPGGRKLIGMALDADVSATTISDYLTPEGLELSVEVEQPAVVRDGHFEGETTLKHQDGHAIPVAVASFLMFDVATGAPFALATVQRDISDRVAADRAMADLLEQRTALLTRLVDAQDAERARIAADVHDDPVQAVAAVDLRMGLLRKRLREQAPSLMSELDGLQETLGAATDRLRSLLFDLEPPELSVSGLAGALQRATEEIYEGTGVRARVDGSSEPVMPEATRAVAYRITKEALVNVLKHARATQVQVALAAVDGGLQVEVHDDGVGPGDALGASAPGHRGVSGMRDRATLAGGHCTVGDSPLGGTLVSLWLPGPTAAPAAAPGLGAGLGLTLAASRSTSLGFAQGIPDASTSTAARG